MSYEWLLAGNMYVMVCKKFPTTVDIRHFWSPKEDEKVVVTHKGVRSRYH